MTITLENLPRELEELIERKAKAEHRSQDAVVIALLEEAAGLAVSRREPALHHDLDDLSGTWSDQEAADFDQSLRAQRQIDPGLWQ